MSTIRQRSKTYKKGSVGNTTEIQQGMALLSPILNTTQEVDLNTDVVNTTGDTEECLLLDDIEKAVILSQRQAVAVVKENKEPKNSVLRGWLSSFVSFFVVIGVGMIGTLWEATSPAYLDHVPRPTPPRFSMRDASLDDDVDAAVVSEEEQTRGGDETDSSSSKPRERHVTTDTTDRFPSCLGNFLCQGRGSKGVTVRASDRHGNSPERGGWR
jgi:hypothetical protein